MGEWWPDQRSEVGDRCHRNTYSNTENNYLQGDTFLMNFVSRKTICQTSQTQAKPGGWLRQIIVVVD